MKYKYRCEVSQMLSDLTIVKWTQEFVTTRMIEGKADIEKIKFRLFGVDRVILSEPVLMGLV